MSNRYTHEEFDRITQYPTLGVHGRRPVRELIRCRHCWSLIELENMDEECEPHRQLAKAQAYIREQRQKHGQ